MQAPLAIGSSSTISARWRYRTAHLSSSWNPGLAWLLPCRYLRAQHPAIKIVRIKTSKVAALRRHLKQDAKSDRLDSFVLAKMPFVDPEKLYAVDLPPAELQGLDRMTRQRARLVEDLTRRKNRLQALPRGYLPGLIEVVGKPWERRRCRRRIA